jgi:hypothetical protein
MGDPYTEDIESGVRTEEARLLARTENSFHGHNPKDRDHAGREALNAKPYNSGGDGVGVYVCCLCCFRPRTSRKTFFPEPRIVTDGLFAILWVLIFLSGVGLFVYDTAHRPRGDISKNVKTSTSFLTGKQRERGFALISTALLTCAVCLSIAFLNLRYATRGFVQFSGLSCLAFLVLVSAMSSNPWMIIFIALMLYFMYLFRAKLPLSIEVIRVSMEAVWAHKTVLVLPIFSMVVHTAWMILCFLLFSRLLSFKWHLKEAKTGQFFSCLFLLFFYWVWTAELIRYVVDYVTSSVVASWVCFDTHVPGRREKIVDAKHAFQAKSPTASAFKFAFFHNLGTLALASLIIAAIETLKFAMEVFCKDKDGRDTCASCLIRWLLSCIRDQLEYMNKYVVTYCAIFNSTFCQGTGEFQHCKFIVCIGFTKLFFLTLFHFCTAVMQNSGSGFTAFFQDEVTGIIIIGASVTVGVFTSIMTTSVAVLFLGVVKFATVAAIAFVFGLVIAFAALGVVKSAVTALFICLIAPETSPTFEENHPEVYAKLSSKFKAGNDATREVFSWLPPCVCICF